MDIRIKRAYLPQVAHHTRLTSLKIRENLSRCVLIPEPFPMTYVAHMGLLVMICQYHYLRRQMQIIIVIEYATTTSIPEATDPTADTTHDTINSICTTLGLTFLLLFIQKN